MASKGFPNPIDVHVGGRIRLRRTLLGFSQMALAEALGLTFQQVQKYERGSNRVSSSRLFDLSKSLDVPVAYFFEEMEIGVTKQSPGRLAGRTPKRAEAEIDPVLKRETLELVRAYYAIEDRALRQKLVNLIRSISVSD
jgi:transcriptional regulator with XRE-family HTH domain